MAYLALVRHTESEWNAKGLWTGLTDIRLSMKGINQALQISKLLKDTKFDIAYTSKLQRAKETFQIIRNQLEWKLPVIENEALNERDYGIYTGKNKWEIQKEVGDEEFKRMRRGWNVPLQGGESLKQVYERVIPYYKEEILPKLEEGKNVLIVAHGNSLRSLTKYLMNLSEDEISKLEIEVGEVDLFEIDNKGEVVSKKILKKGLTR